MKGIIFFLGLILSSAIYAETFKLLSVEKDEPEEDSPVATTYTYSSAKELNVSYRYGFDLDMSKYELQLHFEDADTQNTKLRGYLSVYDDEHEFLNALGITNKNPKQGCYYVGKALVKLDEVLISIYDHDDGAFGLIDLNKIKDLQQNPKLECNN